MYEKLVEMLFHNSFQFLWDFIELIKNYDYREVSGQNEEPNNSLSGKFACAVSRKETGTYHLPGKHTPLGHGDQRF